MPDKSPNIILIITHDTGRWHGCYGTDLPTPSIDAVAAAGARMDRYFCTYPMCSPSRASILTGKYPHTHGLMALQHVPHDMVLDTSITLPKCLAGAGYSTHLFGFQHEHKDARELGYETVVRSFGPKWTDIDRAANVAPAVEWFLRSRPDGPFFASVGFFETHRPFDEPCYTPADPDAVRLPGWLEDTPHNRLEMAQLHGLARAADEAVGRIDRALHDSGLADNTIFIITTDHGMHFRRAKATLYDAGIATGLIIRWPERISPGTVCDAMLSNIDLMPTLLEAVGLETPEGVQGESFLAALTGADFQGRSEIFAEQTYRMQYDPMRCIRTDTFKLIRNFDPDAIRPLIPEQVRDERNWVAERKATWELYDLQTDPQEQRNLAGLREFTEVESSLRGRLEAWMRETDDPILNGPISKWVRAPMAQVSGE